MGSIIQTFQLSEHTQVPMSSDKQGSTVCSYTLEFVSCLISRRPFQVIFWKCMPILAQCSKGLGGGKEGREHMRWKVAKASQKLSREIPQ